MRFQLPLFHSASAAMINGNKILVMRLKAHRSWTAVLRIFVVLLCCLPHTLHGFQMSLSNINNLTQSPKPGTPHDYLKDLSEIVNPANGSVMVRILAATPSERDSVRAPQYAYIYSSNGHQSPSAVFVPIQQNGQNTSQLKESSVTLEPQRIYPPNSWTSVTVDIPINVPNQNGIVCTVHLGYMYIDPSGVRHPLGLKYFGEGQNTANCQTGGISISNYFTGGDLQYKARLVPYWQSPTNQNVLYVTDVHGNEMVQFEDTNGNMGQHWGTNTSGRTYTVGDGLDVGDYSVSAISVPGLGDSYAETKAPQISRSSAYTLNFNLMSGFQNSNCQSASSQGTLNTVSITYPAGTSFQPNGIETLTLPNQQTYKFEYDTQYGLIKKITYPTGAWVEYQWQIDPQSEGVVFYQYQSGYNSPSCGYRYDKVAVKSRIVSYDGVSPAQEQDFTYATNWTQDSALVWSTKVTTITTTDLLTTGHPSFKTVYTYVPGTDYDENFSATNSQQHSPIPVENKIEYFDTNGSALRTVNKTWYTQDQLAGECITLPSGKMSGTFYKYQGFNSSTWAPGAFVESGMTDQVTDKAEYDFGTLSACSRPSSTPLRETVTEYKAFPATPIAPADQTIMDRPLSVKVYSQGSLIAETDYEYDGGGSTSYAVSSVSPKPFGHDETHYSAQQASLRGNLTKVTRKCLQASVCSDSVFQYTYDETGQVTSVTDGNSQTTQISYADSFTEDSGGPPSGFSANLYVSKITRPNGLYETFIWDYNKGQLRSAKDVYENETKYRYDDPWARITETGYPDGATVTWDRNDKIAMTTPYNPTVTATTTVNADGIQKSSVSVSDPLGHEIESEVSDPQGTVYVATAYDGLGRKSKVWNPSRCNPLSGAASCTGESTFGATTYQYDALNRVTKQSNPDGTSRQWCYDGTQSSALQTNCHSYSGIVGDWTDYANENGSDWMRLTNSLGQLVTVLEPTTTNTAPTMRTDYSYDALGNLLSVNQRAGGGRTRSFTYDSLSHLRTAFNPETRTICYGIWSSGGCGSGYDGNGNLLHKTIPQRNDYSPSSSSARINYAYDSLNRLVSKTYQDDPTKTPSSCYQYDSAIPSVTDSYPKGHLTMQWTQAGACASGIQSSVPDGAISATIFSQHDKMGRAQNEQQCTPSSIRSNTCYSIQYKFDYLGDVTSYTNGLPSTPGAGTGPLTFSQAFWPATGSETAGYLQSVTSNWNSSLNGMSLLNVSGFTPHGAIERATFGTNLAMVKTYDNRLRITGEVDTGTPPSSATPGTSTVTITGMEQSK